MVDFDVTDGMQPPRIAVVGGSGFVGRAMTEHLVAAGIPTTVLSRTPLTTPPPTGVTVEHIPDYAGDTVVSVLEGCPIVIYLAARAHMLTDRSSDPLTAFRQANRDTPLGFVEQAARAGLRRLVFVSTIGVNGGCTAEEPFRATDPVHPHSPYAQSKWEAEEALRDRCAALNIALVIVRPPLVYGSGAPGNFARLMRLAMSGIPLPLGAVHNQRSLIGIDNLCDLLRIAAIHSDAPGHVLLVSDGDDLSTGDLLRGLRKAAGRPARLFPVPVPLLRRGMELAGSPAMATQLLASLQIDAAPTRALLEWHPPLTTAEGLRRCVEGKR